MNVFQVGRMERQRGGLHTTNAISLFLRYLEIYSYLRSYEVGSFARSAHGRKHGHQDARQHQLRENQCSIQEELSGPGFEDTRNALVYGGKGTSKHQNHQTIFLPGTRTCRIRFGVPFKQPDPLSDTLPGVFVVWNH